MTEPRRNPIDRRAYELDTIAAVLPMERRDELAELLTDKDVETLHHLINQGMGDNTLRALVSDLAYIEAWGLAATGHSIPWPVPEALHPRQSHQRDQVSDVKAVGGRVEAIAHAAGAAGEVDHVLHVMQRVQVGAADSAGESANQDLSLVGFQIGDLVADQLLVPPDHRAHDILPFSIAALPGLGLSPNPPGSES